MAKLIAKVETDTKYTIELNQAEMDILFSLYTKLTTINCSPKVLDASSRLYDLFQSISCKNICKKEQTILIHLDG